ncbi:hypothetical protein ACRRTK_004805 [Alexandromys fortis]
MSSNATQHQMETATLNWLAITQKSFLINPFSCYTIGFKQRQHRGLAVQALCVLTVHFIKRRHIALTVNGISVKYHMVTEELYPSALTLELLLSPGHNVEKMKESLCLEVGASLFQKSNEDRRSKQRKVFSKLREEQKQQRLWPLMVSWFWLSISEHWLYAGVTFIVPPAAVFAGRSMATGQDILPWLAKIVVAEYIQIELSDEHWAT